jgi:hypothetical protein
MFPLGFDSSDGEITILSVKFRKINWVQKDANEDIK